MGVSSGGVSNYVNTSSGIATGVCAANGVSGGGVYVDIGFSPLSLFSSGADGFWLDLDPDTWFEDTAQTIPTTFGNPIGAWQDKSGNALHALQSVAASRPTYGRMPFGGVRNKLLATDTLSTQSVVVSAIQQTLSFTGLGTVTLSGVSVAGPLIGTGVNDRVSLTFTPTAGTLTLTVVGSVTLAQLENGAAVTSYQKVVQGYDVTESGVVSVACPWLDGVNDFMDQTASASGLVQNVGRFTVFGGVNFTESLIANQPILHVSTGTSANSARAILRGTATSVLGAAGARLDADSTETITFAQSTFSNTIGTGVFDYANAGLFLRKNGTLVASDLTFQTAGNTDNTASLAVYVGRINTGYLGGFIPGIVAVAADTLSDSQLLQTETYIGRQIGGTGL